MTAELDRTSFLYGTNSAFIEELYARYLGDPGSVDESWRGFFADLGDDLEAVLADSRGAPWGAGDGRPEPSHAEAFGLVAAVPAAVPAAAPAAGPEAVQEATRDSISALMLIRAFRVRGHLIADLDPLGLEGSSHHPELDPKSYGFTAADYERPIFINWVLGLEWATLREIMEVLKQTYCGPIGYEFMHIQHPEQKAWIQERVEGPDKGPRFRAEERRELLQILTRAEGLERFLHLKYTGTKRFGLDGGESLIPAMETAIARAAQLGVKEIVLGMPHRGRLNVLANVMEKPYQALFAEFQGNPAHPQGVQGSGDVKYHLGTSADRDFDGNAIHLSLTANPSHLEAVNPLVIGKVRAKQVQRGGDDRTQVLGILLHGDAAFAGQGIIAECFGLSQLRGYKTGGTIHIIVNNQIGFTTAPKFSRSSSYPSDSAKMVQAPIFHVNGDDPEAASHVAKLAVEFRQKFGRDVVIDMFCYRRHGHNEGDEPAFTQPLMYRCIAEHPTTRQLYAARLEADGVIGAGEGEDMATRFHGELEREFEAAPGYKPNKADWLEGRWSGLEVAKGDARRGQTAVELATLKAIGANLTEVPKSFNLHRSLVRQLARKAAMFESGKGIDWATAEALAFGSLLLEGCPVRLCGQDSGRGTFSQRHAVLVDQETEARHVPLSNLSPGQAYFEVHDSMLSEAAVLGFEYGYSLAEPNALVLWEAQFGDFANGAQVIIDQFMSAGEAKWLRMSGLVMLLPHGQEGQGPEHSSARLERYLQLCAEDNMQVANCTTPASYFHILRRQIHRRFRKTLVIMTPKSLLRHKRATSSLEDMGPGSSFHRVLWDDDKQHPDAEIRRVVLCSGKVYYDLFEERAGRQLEGVYFLRVEQLYPFPTKALMTELGRFKHAEVLWCQEEPMNMGAWSYMAPRLEAVLQRLGGVSTRPRYVGPPEAAAPAPGTAAAFQAQQAKLVDQALSLA
ncbi:MAG: 2-oxoglutarate dehydrogenase E1 component [Alphaproteobacteria bacterium]|nr:2-oxoglutarate dehydrogenase E1 component [Alphaproteobacteria bacterium]